MGSRPADGDAPKRVPGDLPAAEPGCEQHGLALGVWPDDQQWPLPPKPCFSKESACMSIEAEPCTIDDSSSARQPRALSQSDTRGEPGEKRMASVGRGRADCDGDCAGDCAGDN